MVRRLPDQVSVGTDSTQSLFKPWDQRMGRGKTAGGRNAFDVSLRSPPDLRTPQGV